MIPLALIDEDQESPNQIARHGFEADIASVHAAHERWLAEFTRRE